MAKHALDSLTDEVSNMTPEDQDRLWFRTDEDRIMKAVSLWPDLDRIKQENLSKAELCEVVMRITDPVK
jgi:hypothetical protein